MTDDAYGSFGGTKHYGLIKAATLRVIDRYYEKYSRVVIENTELSLEARNQVEFGSSMPHFSHTKEINPDVSMATEPGKSDERQKKLIIVECETRADGLLVDQHRLTAYDLLRLGRQDRSTLMLYIAFPESLRGEVEKPDAFNDLWFFDVEARDDV